MNNRGFTLVELVATFALCSAIIFLLINIVLIIKNVYVNYELKTQLIINQGTLSTVLNEKLIDKKMTTYSSCSNSGSCYIFYYEDYALKLFVSDDTIKAYTYGTLEYISDNKTSTSDYVQSSETISYDGKIYYLYTPYVYPNSKGSTIGSIDLKEDLNFIVIKIPIKNKLFNDEDFGINLLYRKPV